MALPTITNNSPSAGYIKWTAFGIQYNGQSFSIPAGQTNNKFVWWLYNGGVSPQLVAGDTLPTLTADDIVLFLNKNGIGALVPTTQTIDGSLVVSGSILADGIGANQIQGYHIIANAVTATQIAANAVQAQHIVSGAITTEKLSVGSVGDNMVANGSFEDGIQGWNAIAGTGGSADIVTGVSSSGAYALRIIRGTTNKEIQQLPQFYIPVTSNAGHKWYVSCQAGAGVTIASGFYFRAYWYQADRTTAASTAFTDIVSNVGLSTTWSNFEAQVTPPANARYMALRLINASGTSTMYVDEVVAHEVVTAAVIGDGQITTAKMVANSIAGDRITTNTLHGNAIIANTITADKLSANAIDGKTITGVTVQGASVSTTPSTTPTNTKGVWMGQGYGLIVNGDNGNRQMTMYNGHLFVTETINDGTGRFYQSDYGTSQIRSHLNTQTEQEIGGFDLAINGTTGEGYMGLTSTSSGSAMYGIKEVNASENFKVYSDKALTVQGQTGMTITTAGDLHVATPTFNKNLYLDNIKTTVSDIDVLTVDRQGKVAVGGSQVGVFAFGTLYGAHPSWQPPILEKVGTRVHFHGTVTVKQTVTFAANTAYVMGTIPVGFRPKNGYQVFQPGASSPGIASWVGAYINGTVEFALLNGGVMSANAWILGFDLWWETDYVS